LLAAGFGAVHLVALSLFSVAGLPEVPPAAAAMCGSTLTWTTDICPTDTATL